MKQIQLIVIHGGMTFKNRKDYVNYLKTREITINNNPNWKDQYLKCKLEKYCEIIKPRMPLKENAKYEDWKIHFERYIPYLKDNIILIGESLGAIFLAKYLSENKFPKKIVSTYLVAPPFDNTLLGEDLVGGFTLSNDLSLLEENSSKLYLIFSKDDDVVPISHAKKYQKKLQSARIIIFNSKNGHFEIKEFTEIVNMIKGDIQAMV